MNRLTLATFVAAVSLIWGGCRCGTNPPPPGDSGVPVTTCSMLGEPCGATQLCCVGACGVGGTCEQGAAACLTAGAACNDGLDCCTGRCGADKKCSDQQCLDTNAVCTANGDCCTGNCANGTCAVIPGAGSCRVVGQACGGGGQEPCCSTNCQNGFCKAAYSCRPTNDLCFNAVDCCSGLCSKNDGSPGYCILPSGGCTQEGIPCSSGTNCCTRVCADPGTGAKVCLPATGCRMTGNTCVDHQSCCGGGTNPNGDVTCDFESASDLFGRCGNGQSCNPAGNICSYKLNYPDGGSKQINAANNCCTTWKGKNGDACKLDTSGIPRCFGGQTDDCPNGYTGSSPCCIAEGEVCQFKDQCCNGVPCVADEQGVLRCTGSSCIPLGASCTQGGAGCCAGQCLAAGELGGSVCQIPSDAGVACKSNGSGCAAGAECCSLTCSGGVCLTPTACQPRGATCSSSADCCSGTSCQVPAGSSAGTCEASSCANAGQSCSTTNLCCTGFDCLDTSGNYCNGTTACTCTVIIN